MTVIDVPNAPAITGLYFRTYESDEDVPAMTRVMNAAVLADHSPEYRSEAMVRNWLKNPSGVDPQQDVLLAFVAAELVGVTVTQFEDASEGMRHYQALGYIEPGWRRHGLGTALLPHGERRLRALAQRHDHQAPPLLATFVDGPDVGAAELVRRNGYALVRTYQHMVRPDMDDILVADRPEGIHIRPPRREELRAVWAGMAEAFRDHFGANDTSDAHFQRWVNSPRMDLSLLKVAFDGDEVAAAVQGAIVDEENDAHGYQRGWTDPIFTRRAWCRRGLASACLGQALAALRERGMTSAQLGVDTENPNDAPALYRRHRFESVQTETEWHKPLELAP
jgi:mycothiol synthase